MIVQWYTKTSNVVIPQYNALLCFKTAQSLFFVFLQNRTLRLDNESLRKHSEAVTMENSELRVRLGLTPPVSPAPVSTNYPPTSEASPDTKYSPVVIKKEAEYNEYASLSVSQQQERLILFLSLITTWMMINNR